MRVLFYSSFVCISAYATVYFQTTIIKQSIKIILNAGVLSSQALLGFLITAPPSVCISAVLGALAVWIQNHYKKKGRQTKTGRGGRRRGLALLRVKHDAEDPPGPSDLTCHFDPVNLLPLFLFFWVLNPQASAPITSGTHTDGGAVIR